MAGATETVHATALALGAAGVLIRGSSGSGKSDLALRCLGLGSNALLPVAARLVADDQVHITPDSGTVWLTAPATIAGLIEVRGIGIVRVCATDRPVRLVLVADLVTDRGAVPRLPDRESVTVCGLPVAQVALWPFEPSAPLKLMLALQHAAKESGTPS